MEKFFETKDGVVLYWTGNTFYTENEEAICKALEEDLNSPIEEDRKNAQWLLKLIQDNGLVVEV